MKENMITLTCERSMFYKYVLSRIKVRKALCHLFSLVHQHELETEEYQVSFYCPY